MVFKRCFDVDENKLSPLELFVFCHLFRSRLQYLDEWLTSTNIFLIHSKIKCKVDGLRVNDKLDKIKSCLISLRNKGYIFCDVSGKTKYNDLLNIKFATMEHEEQQEKVKGFLQLDYNLFDTFTDREKLYIFTYLESGYNDKLNKHFNNVISYNEWSKILDVSDTTAENRIASMNRADSIPRIYKFSGDYRGTKRQDDNVYFTRPVEKLLLKYNNFYDENGKSKHTKKKKYSADDIIYSPFHEEVTVEEFEEIVEFSAWGRESDDYMNVSSNYEPLKMEDYFTYRTCKEFNIYPSFIKKCEHIIRAKKDSFNYDQCFEKWEQDFVSENVSEIVEEYERLQQEVVKERYKRYENSVNEDYSDENPF